MLQLQDYTMQIKNKIQSISLNTFIVVVALWLSAALNLGFYEKILALTPYDGVKAGLFVFASFMVVFSIYFLVLQLFAWKWTAKIVAILLVIIGGFSAYFVNTLGITITSDQVQNMMQTDIREAKGLMSMHLFVWVLFTVILPVMLISFFRIRDEKVVARIVKKLGFSVASLAVVAGLAFTFYIDFAQIFRENRDLKGMISPQNAIASTLSYYHKKAPKQNLPLIRYGEDAHLVEQVSQKAPKLMVLVVGETARAESFSLNGYAKNTNPELSKLNVMNFSQVSSCGTATAVSVPCMFSGMPRINYDEQLASHREGMLDIAQRAGYKVTWIDNNSGCKGACDRVEQYQIPQKIKEKWCDAEGECLDGILVDSLKQYLSDIPKDDTQSRLIVLHQMGSHGPAYYKRSTDEFKPFKPTCDSNAIQGCDSKALINSYDNSIVYTDHILSEVIKSLQENQKFSTAFWYLSDHGESTGEKGLYLHGAPYAMAPTQQTHIPMVLWFSPEWKKQHAQQVACLDKSKNANLSQDNLFPTMLSVLGVKTKVIDSKYDVMSQCQIQQGA